MMVKRQQGFTLLELMIVIVLLGIFSMLVMMTVPSDRQDNPVSQAETLADAIQLAADRALMEGRMMGVVIHDNGWQIVELLSTEKQSVSGQLLLDYFHEQGDTQWQPWKYRRLPLERTLPDAFQLSLSLQGLKAETRASQTTKDVNPVPQIWLFPGGEMTPFDITLVKKGDFRNAQVELRITGDILGRIQLIDPSEAGR